MTSNQSDAVYLTLQRYALEYACEKLWAAIRLLALYPGDRRRDTKPGDVRSRLRAAFDEVCVIHRDNLPSEIVDELDSITAQMTRYPPSSKWVDGPVEETMRRIRPSTATKIAQRIIDLYEKIGNPLSLAREYTATS